MLNSVLAYDSFSSELSNSLSAELAYLDLIYFHGNLDSSVFFHIFLSSLRSAGTAIALLSDAHALKSKNAYTIKRSQVSPAVLTWFSDLH